MVIYTELDITITILVLILLLYQQEKGLVLIQVVQVLNMLSIVLKFLIILFSQRKPFLMLSNVCGAHLQEIRPWTHMMEVPQLHGFGPAANRLLEAYKMLLKVPCYLCNFLETEKIKL